MKRRMRLHTQNDDTAILSQLEDLRTKVDQLVQHDAYLEECLDHIQAQVQEISHGDLFRRIEFLQGESLRIEHLLQCGMASKKDQQLNSIYTYILRMKGLFSRLAPDCSPGFVRVGNAHDGGYVMLNDFAHRNIAYSIGINDDVSWDFDMAERGFDVYMYDHTIEKLPT